MSRPSEVVTGRLVSPLHPFHDLAEAGAGADRARAERHRLLGRDVLSAENRAPPEPAENDAAFIDDEAGVPAALFQALAHFPQPVLRMAGGNVGPEVGARPCLAALRPLERESGASPIGLSGDVVVDLLEADALEPRRGSWA
jgi:hypothetical protein